MEAVRPLWDRATAASDADWNAALDLILEELEDWRLEVATHAYTVTSFVGADSDEEGTQREIDFEEGNDVDLVEASSLASSFVSCSFDDCRSASRRCGKDRHVAHDKWVGSLEDVLRHQHLVHNSRNCLESKELKDKSQPIVRLSASLEVACAISALLDLADLDPAPATGADLDNFEQRSVLWWEWENSRIGKRNYGDWHDLVRISRLPKVHTLRRLT